MSHNFLENVFKVYTNKSLLSSLSTDGAPEFLTRKLQDYQSRVLRSLGSPAGERAAALLLQLAPLKGFSATFIEDVFFVGFVGDVSIDDVIPYLLNAERWLWVSLRIAFYLL